MSSRADKPFDAGVRVPHPAEIKSLCLDEPHPRFTIQVSPDAWHPAYIRASSDQPGLAPPAASLLLGVSTDAFTEATEDPVLPCRYAKAFRVCIGLAFLLLASVRLGSQGEADLVGRCEGSQSKQTHHFLLGMSTLD
jgi:hypothetical protein